MVVRSSDTGTIDVNELGGKGSNLLRLTQAGYPVPAFVIIPVSFFVNKTAAEVTGHLESILPEMLAAFKGIDTLFAVRSSAVAEDSDAYSFAGQFKTLLNIPAAQLVESIREVWTSSQNEQLDVYKAHASVADLPMAVVVQQMIPATVAGVAFGIDPITGAHHPVINAVQGLGEALVSGEKNADSYKIDAEGAIHKELLADQALLTDSQVRQVSEILHSLADLFGQPQDIEFAYVDKTFFLLQARPVTVRTAGQKITWDNSNIVESYPGLTLPLTFSFIEKMYEAVYIQLSGVLGITASKISADQQAYANMLGLLNGRVYYNLNSWYKVLSLLPGYQLNAEFMERMMGVKDKPDIKIDTPRSSKLQGYWEVARALAYMVRNIATIKKQKETFIKAFDQIYSRFDKKDYRNSTMPEVLEDYYEFEQMMVRKWKAPLVNDFFAMIYFGLLQKLAAKYFPQHPDIHNQLIGAAKDIITTEPIRQLPALVALFSENKDLREMLLSQPPAATWKALHASEYESQLAAINRYLEKWGERCIAELKLETITYTQQPEKLVGILRSYAANNYLGQPTNNHTDEERKKAEQIVAEVLAKAPLKRMLFSHVLKNARYLVSNRENLRYYRTRGFGMVRRMMMAVGHKLEVQGLIQSDRDIFYLRLDELDAINRNELPRDGVGAIVEQRKKDYALYDQLPLPERIETYGKQDKIVLPAAAVDAAAVNGELRGIPCSSGVVRAKVKLMRYADELDSLNNQVMATYATDPGWVVLFPSVSGILTERGSLLSHAAIVSREMGIPCIVGIDGLMNILKNGDEIIMDGSTGIVKIIKQNSTSA